MNTQTTRHEDNPLNYHNRIFLALIVVLFVAHVIFRFIDWNPRYESQQLILWDDVVFEEVALTVQADAMPPPPRPRVGIPEISDEILTEEPDWSLFSISTEDADAGSVSGGETDGPAIIENPQHPPRVRRIVEAVTPAEARGLEERVEVTVTLLVMPNGRVHEVFISEIVLVDAAGQRTTVQHIGYGIIEETIRAASGWIFVPARHNGEPVASYSQHRFNF